LQNRIDYLGEDADSKQAIIDLAKQYGLVTDYTSMIIVREEVFKQLNLSRDNAKRVEKEMQARQERSKQPVRDNRKDTQQPAFNTARAYPSSGGGANDIWFILLMVQVLLVARANRKTS